MNKSVKFLRTYYPQYSDEKIQTLIDSATQFEIERKRFVLSIPSKETKKKIKAAVKVNGILVYQNT